MRLKEGAKAAAKGAVALPTATVVGFWKGLTYPFKGAKFVFFEHPRLVRFWIVPIVLTAALFASVLWAGWAWHEEVADLIWSDPSERSGELLKEFPPTGADKGKPAGLLEKPLDGDAGVWVDVGHWLHEGLEILVLLMLWTVGIVLVVFLSNVVAAPFNDLLSEEVEHLLIGRKGPAFSLKILMRDSVRTFGLEAVKMVLYLLVMVPLYLLSLLVPAVGQVLYSVFAFLFTALYFAVDYVDWPASRRNRNISYRFGMLKAHVLPMFGLGTGVWLFLFIPLVNLLFMPAAVAGGTMLFLELEAQDLESQDRHARDASDPPRVPAPG